MNKQYILSFVLAGATCMGAWAQQAGDVISGTVSDEFDVLAGVHVVEINKDDRVMASGITDINGNFSFAIRNPQDRIKITYIGMKTKIIPIKGLTYKILLEQDNHELQEVVVSQKRRTQTSGLDIPQTEVSQASQTISAQEFEGMPITTIDEALQGRIAGLDIVLASGNLGAGTSMRLRGVSSINGNTEPLVVVDGNVFESDYNKDFDFANATEDKFAELLQVNPEDIESITVLKDAAATAIWGSQGANGVIEIKTKRGSRGATKVTYTYRANVTYQPTGTKMMNGGQYTMYLKEAYFNPKLSDDAANIKEISYLHSDAEFSEWRMYDNNTDWIDAVTQVGLEQKHFLSLTGGGEKANFRVSAGYDHQTGSVIEQVLDRFTSRTALDYFISNRIKVTSNFNFTYTNNNKNMEPTINGGRYGLLSLAYVKMPNLAIYEEDENGSTGEFYHVKNSASSQFDNDQKLYPNPVALGKEAKNNEKTFNIQPEFIIQYDLLGTDYDEQRLKYDGKINFSIFNKYNHTFYPSSLVNDDWSNTNNNLSYDNSYKSFALTTTHTLTYTPVFSNPDHSLMAMGRFQLTAGESRSQTESVYGLPTGTIQSSTADGVIGKDFNTSASEWRSLYLTASLHYAYKGRYIVDLTYRRDGSTKFGKDSRWGNFPGVSFRWNISDEKFMNWSDEWLSMLSIRPGWGIVGNQPSAENLFYAKYASTSAYMGHAAIYPSNIALNSLKWEEKESYNIGIDLGFLNDKITADVNVYKQMTRDLLMLNYQIPGSSGFGSLSFKNAGDMKNVGWEFNVNTNRLIKWGKDRKWGLDLNITFANNKNELVKMDETILESLNGDFNYNNGSYLTRVQLNNAFGSIYGFRYKGVYQYSAYSAEEVPGVSGPNAPVVRNENGNVVLDENGATKPVYFAYGTTSEYKFMGGDAIYEDINHDGNINELDIVYLGSSLPKLTGGFGFKLTWGRLSWNNQFNFRYGNKIINKARMQAESMYDNNNQSKAVNWRWRVEGDITEIPRATYQYGYNWLGSDRFVEDGSFLRLNYSSLNYSIDPKVVKRYGLSQVSFFISGSNLFCITKYSGADPEVSYGSYGVVYDTAKTPRARSFSVGATVQF
ncbi:MAG: SusC/RagA family TonB-linked outer membrane protein [Bacteroidales bacterium]|nr:SusC/RagA family TonB-linked outer membrane protein [Bacteroidales bacterium]